MRISVFSTRTMNECISFERTRDLESVGSDLPGSPTTDASPKRIDAGTVAVYRNRARNGESEHAREKRSATPRTQVWRNGKDLVYSDEDAVSGIVEALDNFRTSVSEGVHADVDFSVP